MTEQEYLRDLESEQDKLQRWGDAAEFFIKLKRPNPYQEDRDHTKEASPVTQFLKDKLLPDVATYVTIAKNPLLLGLTLGSAAATGGAAYAAFRPSKRLEGKSYAQKGIGLIKDKLDDTEDPGLLRSLGQSTANYAKDVADVAQKHPVKASLLAALQGGQGMKNALKEALGRAAARSP